MSESDLQELIAEFERQMRECDTPEKATALLQQEKLLDADGRLPASYGGHDKEAHWQ